MQGAQTREQKEEWEIGHKKGVRVALEGQGVQG